jgi:hypothetical protein
MKRAIEVAVFILMLAGISSPAGAYTQVGFSFDFHNALAPYGSWVRVSGCSNCWHPHTAGFIPYTNGRWVYTTYGMTWEGNEPWAWGPYHYGHWVYSAQYGWLWVPGYEWSPARVSWLYGTDYVGWSPVYNAGPDVNLWVVVHRNHFGHSNYASVRVQRDAVRGLFARRAVQTSRTPLQRAQVERIVHRSIPVVRLKERQVEVDRHRTRLVLPEARERAVVEHITRISHHENTKPQEAHPQVKHQSVKVTEHHPAMKPSGKPSKAPAVKKKVTVKSKVKHKPPNN